MFLLVICLVAFSTGSGAQKTEPFLHKVMDTLKVGFRLASTLLNADQNDVVSSIFQRFKEIHKAYVNVEGGRNSEGLLPFIIRFLGISSSRMDDYAFDGFIFLTHLINSTLTTSSSNNNRKHRSSFVTDFSPFQYVIQQPQVVSLLTQMEDPNVVEFVLRESDRKLKMYPPEDVECIPLLVCKTMPFVRGMQRSLRFFINREKVDCYRNVTDHQACEERLRWENSNYEDKMFFFLPGLDEVIANGDECDERFPKCVY